MDGQSECCIIRSPRCEINGAIDTNWVAWELAKSKSVGIICYCAAFGVNGSVKLGGDVGNLGSRILERIVGVIRLVVVAVSVRIAGRCNGGELRR